MSSPRPIRTRILRIIVPPLVALLALWAVIAASSAGEILGLFRTGDEWQAVGVPTRNLVVQLQEERQLAVESAVGAGGGGQDQQEQRRATDAARQRLRSVTASLGLEDSTGAVPDAVRDLTQALDELDRVRAAVDSGSMTPLQVIDAYTQIIRLGDLQTIGSDALTDVPSFRMIRSLAMYLSAAEHLSREHALLTISFIRDKMTPGEHTAFVSATTSRRMTLENAERDMSPQLRSLNLAVTRSEGYTRLIAAEDAVLGWNLSGRSPVNAEEWNDTVETALIAHQQHGLQELNRLQTEGGKLISASLWRIGLVLGTALLVVAVSAVVSYRFGRSLISELRRLQARATEMAEVDLPRLVERLRRGEDVDPRAEAPIHGPRNQETGAQEAVAHETTETLEVDRVAAAFAAVRRTAVEAAVGQAELRRGVGLVFLNLARRSQVLLHRQLTLLDAMERRVEEPDTLEDLFRLDHLTTRMRRHAENLIILSDAVPGRRWSEPVPVLDVARSAVLEVEEYTRVSVIGSPRAPLLLGAAVTDVIHLVAELVENATVFSPPNTSVLVRGMEAANGFALEIEDRGLGLSQNSLEEINARLAEPPEFDLADSDRLGLFVVARLAARHGIKVVLRPSPYAGTTAIVMLPPSVLVAPEEAAEQATVVGAIREEAAAMARAPLPALNPVSPDAAAGPRTEDPARRRGGFLPATPSVPATGPESRPRSVPPHLPGDAPRQPSAPADPTWREHAPTTPGAGAAADHRGEPSGLGAADDDLDGLPRRVRQASLAPQLRRKEPQEPQETSTRSPEELLELMTSMQEGWKRGRDEVARRMDMWNGKESQEYGGPGV
ncbi:sensor histidine kinase [Sphaerimonospora sp. CA-214678]|uniref:sensor histidine kinase n=1 Tax=Sphaerimonospora sp. CA-214678 TaxID=3240029 RepID=UPI003D8E9680